MMSKCKNPMKFTSKHIYSMQRSLENLNVELSNFERNFVSSYNQICWASDYTELHALLKNLVKERANKQLSVCDNLHSKLFDELGISCFIEDNKIQNIIDASVQLFEVDLMVAETGQLLFCNKPLEYIESLYNSKLNVFITTIERLVGTLSLADAYCRFDNKMEGERCNHNTLFKGSGQSKNQLIIVDNSRTNLLAHKEQRRALTCIQCGHCEEVCPIDQLVGKEYYNNVFTGPIGRVVLPHLECMDTYGHVVWNCTLCGKCEDVCPLRLPLRDMIVANRQELLAQGEVSAQRQDAFDKMKKYLMDRSRLNRGARRKQQAMNKNLSHDLHEIMQLPQFADRTFNQMVDKAK